MWDSVFFFFPWKSKVPGKAIFAYFFHFFHAWKIVFTGTFFGFFPFSSRVHKSVSRAEFIKKVIIFAGKIAQNFSRAPIFFHGWNLTKIFTGKIFLSRALFGQKPRIFHGRIFFFTGKKKNTGRWFRVITRLRWEKKGSSWGLVCSQWNLWLNHSELLIIHSYKFCCKENWKYKTVN